MNTQETNAARIGFDLRGLLALTSVAARVASGVSILLASDTTSIIMKANASWKLTPLGDDVVDNSSVDISQPEIAAGPAIRELLMVKTQQL